MDAETFKSIGLAIVVAGSCLAAIGIALKSLIRSIILYVRFIRECKAESERRSTDTEAESSASRISAVK